MKLTFGTFPRLRNGYDDDGAPVMLDGNVVGHIQRQVRWRDVGAARAVYRPTVEGYAFLIGRGFPDAAENDFLRRFGITLMDLKVFATAAEARAALRTSLKAAQPVARDARRRRYAARHASRTRSR